MTRMRMSALVLLLCAVATLGFAQSGAAGRRPSTPSSYNITVTANVLGATVSIDGKPVGTAPVTIALAPGSHAVSVTAQGYAPYSSKINVTQVETLSVSLAPLAVRVTLSCNVQGADIVASMPGQEARGKSPFTAQLLPGTYTVSVTAAGYKPYSGRVVVGTDANQSFAFTLDMDKVRVEISTNVPATINLMGGKDEVSIQARTPAQVELSPGTYNVVLNAVGYQQAIRGITVDPREVDPRTRMQRFSFTLEPMMATLNLVYPRQFLDPDIRDEREARRLVKVWLDGKLLNPKSELLEVIPVLPGRHRLRVTSGGLSFQTDDYEFQAGQTYTIEVMLQIIITASPRTDGR